MCSSHVLMFWPEENSYSIVKRKTLVTSYDVAELVGKEVQVVINKKAFKGTVFSIGSRDEMKQAENEAERAALDNSIDNFELESVLEDGDSTPIDTENVNIMTLRKSKKSKRNNSLSPLAPANNVELDLETPQADLCGTEEDEILDETDTTIIPVLTDSKGVMDEKNALIRKLERRNLQLESENRRMKKASKSSSTEPSDNMIALGEGLELSEGYISFLKLSFGRKPSRFFRELVFRSELFRLEDIAASAMKGKAKVSLSTGGTPIDPIKFETLKKFTMLSCGVQEQTWEYAEFREKIKCVCADARKALKRKEPAE